MDYRKQIVRKLDVAILATPSGTMRNILSDALLTIKADLADLKRLSKERDHWRKMYIQARPAISLHEKLSY